MYLSYFAEKVTRQNSGSSEDLLFCRKSFVFFVFFLVAHELVLHLSHLLKDQIKVLSHDGKNPHVTTNRGQK